MADENAVKKMQPGEASRDLVGGGVGGVVGLVKAKNMFAGLLKKNKKESSEEDAEKKNHSAKKDKFLIDACQQGSLSLVKKFIVDSGCSPNLMEGGKALVQLALEGGHEAVVIYLMLECGAKVVNAKAVPNFKEKVDGRLPNFFHINLIKQCVMNSTDREKGFAVAIESLAHSSNQTLSALLLAEMYKNVAKVQPTHRHTLNQNAEILENVAFTLLDQLKDDEVVMILGGLDPNFDNTSPLQVAIRSHNSHFVSHPHVQDLVGKVWIGDDPLRTNYDQQDTKKSTGWDFVLMPKQFLSSPRGHFFLHIYTYLIFIYVHFHTSIELVAKKSFTDEPTLFEHVFTVLSVCGAINECEKCWRQGKDNYLNFFWNYADVLLFVLLLAFSVLRYGGFDSDLEEGMMRQILALSAVPLYIRLLELLVLSRRFGPLMLIIQNVISEVLYFMVLVILMIVAFGQCTNVLFTDPDRELSWFQSFPRACETLFIAMLGVLDESQITEVRSRYEIIGPLVIIIYLIITSIILLNLLIAILSNIYKKIDEKSNEEWMFLWASTVMRLQKEVEETLPPPLNVVLRVFQVLPKRMTKKIVFFILMAVMYTPGCAVMLICYIPYKSLQTLAILLNPNNYITGGGNPFKSDSKISSMDNNNFSTMDHGGGKADQGKRVLSKFWEDNFTNSAEMMLGRDQVAYDYDSIKYVDYSKLSKNEFEVKLGELREELRDIFSMSNSDSVSMVSELLSNQDQQSKILEEFARSHKDLEMRVKHINASLMISQRSINLILQAVQKGGGEATGSSRNLAVGGMIVEDVMDGGIDGMGALGMSPKTGGGEGIDFYKGRNSQLVSEKTAKKIKFMRPRSSTMLKK